MDFQRMRSIRALVEPVRVLFSAAFYLADIVLTSITLVQYYKFPEKLLLRNFYNLLANVLATYVINVIVFKIKVPQDEDPVRSALFFPLIHLWRLVRSPSSSVQREKMSNKSTLFSILTLTAKSSPALAIQYDAIYKKKLSSPGKYSIPLVLTLGIIATLASGVLNGSIAVVSKATNANSWNTKAGVAIASGLYVGSAILLNAITCSTFIVTGFEFFPSVVALLTANFVALWLLFWLVITPGPRKNFKKFGYAATAGFMSTCASPLYVLCSEAQEHGELGTRRYRIKLLFMGIICQTPQFASWILLFVRSRSDAADNLFFIVFGLAQAAYFGSGFAVVLLDYYCGVISDPELESSTGKMDANVDSNKKTFLNLVVIEDLGLEK